MDWRRKAAIQRVLSRLPSGHRLNYLLQRHVTHGFPVTDARLDDDIAVARVHLANLGEHGVVPIEQGRFFEFGAGWDLAMPLILHNLGVSHQLAVDIRPLAQLGLVRDVAARLPQRTERPLPAGDLTDCTTLDALLRRCDIDYRAPSDARSTGLPSGSIDYITSTNTLEHIGLTDIDRILAECRRLLTDNGVMSFQVDYLDHYSYFDPNVGPYDFLQYDDATWSRYNPSLHFQNRLRHLDYLEAYERAGLKVVADDVIEADGAALDALDRLDIPDRRGQSTARPRHIVRNHRPVEAMTYETADQRR